VIVKIILEKQMECRLAGETEVLGENLPQRHFCPSQKFHMTRSGFKSGQACGVCGGKSGTGAGFLRELRFSLPIIILPISPSS
jgi:hypothetical protein